MIQYWIFSTPLGEAGVVAGEKGICRLVLPGWNRDRMISYISDQHPGAEPGSRPAPAMVKDAADFVSGSLMGTPPGSGAELDLSAQTAFQKKVLKIIATIKPGETRSYLWVAEQCGDAKAVRAVAQALAHNPLPLFIPCHRVISRDGSLRGFSAPGGINMKRYLLNLERSGKKRQGRA